MNTIYLITTSKCSACKLQKHLLEKALEGREDIKLEERDFSNTPEFIKTWVVLNDYPTTILVTGDGNIAYDFIGTRNVKEITNLIERYF